MREEGGLLQASSLSSLEVKAQSDRKIRPITRILLAAISVAMVAALFFPIWTITLDAPQYPEGLSMQIWSDHMSGDIRTINGLNHYIGMQEITPESFKELTYMPYIIGTLIAIGLLAAASGRKIMLYTFTALTLLMGVVGTVDFYLWEYDYGHNLDPHAAIKIEGMSYQPPLIGSKQLLNFYATSWPDLGGWAVIGGGAAACLLALYEMKRRKKGKLVYNLPVIILAGITITSCSSGPQPINYGKDACAYCKMSITDKRFGAEIVTKKGKVYKYDAAECMLHAVKDGQIPAGDIAHEMVVDAAQPGILVDAAQAQFLISEKLPSPMGANISAFGTNEKHQEALQQFGGRTLSLAALKLEFSSK